MPESSYTLRFTVAFIWALKRRESRLGRESSQRLKEEGRGGAGVVGHSEGILGVPFMSIMVRAPTFGRVLVFPQSFAHTQGRWNVKSGLPELRSGEGPRPTSLLEETCGCGRLPGKPC